jgi:hypothetical protein
MGLPPPCWTAADGVEVFGWMPDYGHHYATPIIKSMILFSINIKRKHFNYYEFYWPHAHSGYCTWANCVTRNTDETLKRFKDNEQKFTLRDFLPKRNLCVTCRGKGHPWTCEIWNGKAYSGHPSGDEWKHPIKCKDCNGKGF